MSPSGLFVCSNHWQESGCLLVMADAATTRDCRTIWIGPVVAGLRNVWELRNVRTRGEHGPAASVSCAKAAVNGFHFRFPSLARDGRSSLAQR
jgi:hypothetical protein